MLWSYCVGLPDFIGWEGADPWNYPILAFPRFAGKTDHLYYLLCAVQLALGSQSYQAGFCQEAFYSRMSRTRNVVNKGTGHARSLNGEIDEQRDAALIFVLALLDASKLTLYRTA